MSRHRPQPPGDDHPEATSSVQAVNPLFHVKQERQHCPGPPALASTQDSDLTRNSSTRSGTSETKRRETGSLAR